MPFRSRPARPYPYEVSGWTAYCEKSREANGGKLSCSSKTDSAELKQLLKSAHKKLDQIEAEHEAEDTEMLIKLIRIRKGLWT